MVVYKICLVGLDKYVDFLPSRHSEKHLFSLTEDFSKAGIFIEEDLQWVDIEWVEACWVAAFGGSLGVSLHIELVPTLPNSEQLEELQNRGG